MNKPHITRTYGPIHFEDLDPHRFEDLIRELIYDYKDWQSIEATGRSGNDQGFDIRAYEKIEETTHEDTGEGEEVSEIQPMEGNLWMVQGKREKELGPKRVQNIISEIDVKTPPYGYILAASANFSKESYDIFREELRKKGVMEFYLWGKAELEDMLYLPKNDRILFTFFGISFTSKRKTRISEVKSIVVIKNKLYKIFGENYNFHSPVLIRNLKDNNYPYKSEYSDFNKYPRWKEYIAFNHFAQSILCHVHEYYAYIDTKKKLFDITRAIDLTHGTMDYRFHDEEEAKQDHEKAKLVHDFWDFLPNKHKGYLKTEGVLEFADISLIDDIGDIYFKMPHIYIDYPIGKGPFSWYRNIIVCNKCEYPLPKEYKLIDIFPKTFTKIEDGKIHKRKRIILNDLCYKEFTNLKIDELYDTTGNYSFLKPKDIIAISNKSKTAKDIFIQITYKYETTINDYIEVYPDKTNIKEIVKLHTGSDISKTNRFTVYEFRNIYRDFTI